MSVPFFRSINKYFDSAFLYELLSIAIVREDIIIFPIRLIMKFDFYFGLNHLIFKLKKEFAMLDWVIVFFILALVAGVLGFSGIEIMSLEIAKILFVIFLVLFAISLIMRLVGGRRTPLD